MHYWVIKPLTVALATTLLADAPAGAQQFGLPMGASVEQIKAKGVKLTYSQDGDWRTDYLPAGNKMFEDYELTFGTNTGLCVITAWIQDVYSSEGSGKELRDKYFEILDLLKARHGNPTTEEDEVVGGFSHEKSLTYFMATLRSNKRKLKHTWKFNPPKNNITTITLFPLAFANIRSAIRNKGKVGIIYYFSNFPACWNEIYTMKGANL